MGRLAVAEFAEASAFVKCPLPSVLSCTYITYTSAGEPRLMESALLIFAALARYVMGVLTQHMGTLHGLLQVRVIWLFVAAF